MTQSSEERAVSPSSSPSSARIIPFERPQNELQRAVQQRAQERLDAEGTEPKPSTVRRLVTFAVAMIPVAIIFSGFLLAVQAVRVITALYLTPAPTAAQEAPAAEEVQQPGVIMLVPDKSIATSAPDQSTPAAPSK